VDGATDKPVGVTLLTTQSLLQEQRDYLIEQGDMPLFLFRKGPITFEGKRRLVLELRTGLKTGFGSDFFEAAKGPSISGPGPGKYDHLQVMMKRYPCLTSLLLPQVISWVA
jgi:hypothetical protein